MSLRRRSTFVLLALCLLSTATVGQNPAPDQVAAESANTAVHQAALENLFKSTAAAARVTLHPDGRKTITAATFEVVVAKTGPDGKVITACVNDSAGAKRFLAQAAEKQRVKKEQ